MRTKPPLLLVALLGFLPLGAWADSTVLQTTDLRIAPDTAVPAISISTLTVTQSTSGFRAANGTQPFSSRTEGMPGQNSLRFSSLVSADNGTLNISVPEPGSLAMFSAGLVWIVSLVNRRRLK
jgi:hypothetical protein